MFHGPSFLNLMGCCQAKSMNGEGGEEGGGGEGGGREDSSMSKPKTPEGGSRAYLPKFSLDGSSTQSLRGLPDERPHFTRDQKTIVLESWKIIQQDISKVGVVMFIGLFETHPDVQDAFLPFKGQSLDDLMQSRQLKSHVLKVMGTVEKCLARIDEPDKLESLLHDLGAKHLLYNARIDYLDLIGPQFILAVQPAMGDDWTTDVESAWADLFRLLTHIMKEAMVF